ncbi:MAG: GNAT family N-acetyltransferase [Rhodospirillales bacterium]
MTGKAAEAEIETVITWLEMAAPPTSPPPPSPLGPHAIMRADNPTVSFYRYLYNTVGHDHLWWERRALTDEQLRDAVCAENVDVFVLYVAGVPAGYFELGHDAEKNEIDLVYFGLIPEFIGQRYGAFLLRMAIDEAWQRRPARLTVNTCTLDHPNALQLYQRAGFEVYEQKKRMIPDPEKAGYFD